MKTYKHLDVRAVSAERSELKEKAAQYPYVIAHMYSDILCGNCVHDGINWDELVELRAYADMRQNDSCHLENSCFQWCLCGSYR